MDNRLPFCILRLQISNEKSFNPLFSADSSAIHGARNQIRL